VAWVRHGQEMVFTTIRPGLRIRLLAPIWNLVSSYAALNRWVSSQSMSIERAQHQTPVAMAGQCDITIRQSDHMFGAVHAHLSCFRAVSVSKLPLTIRLTLFCPPKVWYNPYREKRDSHRVGNHATHPNQA
jgi:hypothetical protein